MKMKEMPSCEKPRERLLSLGAEALSTGELIAVLIQTGTREKSALDLARELLSDCGWSLSDLSSTTVEFFTSHKGVGPKKAAVVKAALELGRRLMSEHSDPGGKPVTGAGAVYDLLIPRLKGLRHEESWVLYLNNSNRLISTERLTVGSADATVISPREIIRNALAKHASGIILVHNHPGGNPSPSSADIHQTELLNQAGQAFSISLLDHVVICDNCYFSFADDRQYQCQIRTVHKDGIQEK